MHLDRNKNLKRMEILYLVAGVTLNVCRKNNCLYEILQSLLWLMNRPLDPIDSRKWCLEEDIMSRRW